MERAIHLGEGLPAVQILRHLHRDVNLVVKRSSRHALIMETIVESKVVIHIAGEHLLWRVDVAMGHLSRLLIIRLLGWWWSWINPMEETFI